MNVRTSILELVGHTPIVQLNHVPIPGGASIFVKLESWNPGGSVKDRAALNMILAAEQAGKLTPGVSTVVEPTSGNTGIGLAMVCAARGYHCILTMPDNATAERVRILRAYGAEMHLTPAAERMTGAINQARQIAAATAHSFMPMQFENPANPEAHRHTTALEIVDAFAGQLHAVFLTAGTGGTVTGIGHVLKERIPGIQINVVEPAGSPVLSGGTPGPHKIPGTGPGFVPAILDRSVIDRILLIDDADACATARRLATTEGILLGPSGAASVHCAVQATRHMPSTARVLCIAPDSGERYLSSDLYAR